jgi:hypothetical protein
LGDTAFGDISQFGQGDGEEVIRDGKRLPVKVSAGERIITAATEAFTSKGIKSITMDDIVMYKEIHKTVAFLKRTQIEY